MWQQLAADTAAGSGGNIFSMIWPIVLMFVVLYFLLIRPQQKKQKNRTGMLSAMKKGDKVITIGGLHGKIVEMTDDTVVLLVNDATRMTFERSSINSIVAASAPAEEKK